MVPYCSKACQKEHWKSNHKARCVVFSSEKGLEAKALMERVARLVGPLADMSRNLFKTEQLVESHFWALFKSDCGMLGHDRKVEEEDHNRTERSLCP